MTIDGKIEVFQKLNLTILLPYMIENLEASFNTMTIFEG